MFDPRTLLLDIPHIIYHDMCLLGAIIQGAKGIHVNYKPSSSCIVLYCIDGVVIAAQCTATFQDILCSPEFRYY